MAFIDVIFLISTVVAIFSLRLLFPRNIVPLVSTSFEEADTLLQHAEDINMPHASEYRANLTMYGCLYSLAVSLTSDYTQSANPIVTDAYGESSLSGGFSTALSLWFDMEAVCPQIENRCCQTKDHGGVH
jgi:hypothetical protein